MKRRLFSLFLALTLVVGMLPAPAFAQETEPTQVTEAPTEAPATEAPATEVPATEAPATEVPATEVPATEAPATEAPATEAPATEAPAAEPTPAPTEALAPETTVAPAPTEAPTEPAPTEDEAVAAVQAMIDALPDVEDMSESYLDALEAAYSAFDALSEAQQAQINGVEKLEALFGWVNSQVSTLADDVMEISGEVTWDNQAFNTPVKLIGDTTLTLVGDNKIECDAPLDLNNCKLTVKGTGTLEVIGNGRSEDSTLNGAIFDSGYKGDRSSAGTLCLEDGTVTARGGRYNAISVGSVELRGGKLEANGGSNAGIVCSYLYTFSGSLYATGDAYGIEMRTTYAGNPGNLPILISDEKYASIADMDVGTIGDIKDYVGKTYYIGEVSGPMLSVKAQKGYLYEGTAKTATFALSGRNVDLSALTLEWTGSHTGLEAAASADGKTLTVTTDKTVQAGTYGLKVSAGGASRTVVVTVSGPPIRILTQPVDTISTDPEAGAVTVSACPTDGHTGSIAFQWKRADGTPIAGYTDEIVPLYDLVELGMLTQDESKSWLQTIRIYCTLSYDGYSLNTDTVTVGLNSCTHEKVNHEGICAQCGQKKGDGDALLVREDGLYHLIANAEPGEANVGLFMYSGGNFYLTGDVPNKTVNVSCTDVGGKDVTLDLQGHTVKNLKMGNFPYGTFTVKNGTLGEIGTVASGKLILENILYQGKWFDEEFDLTVQGENTRFERQVTFWGTTHLRGGHFDQGLDSNCAGRALELLEDGFAFYDSADKVVDATDSARLVGKQIHVAAHTCHYSNGKCDCGRSCDHQGTTDENGYCTNCGTFVYPFAIGEKLYTGLEAALTAAQEGDTVTLRGDYDMQGATVEIKKSITLELNGHTLSGWPYAPILTILAPDVTIQNGTVKNTDTSKSSPAVQVGTLHTTGAKLTVKNAIFEGSESHGAPRNYGLSIFAGNTAQAENGTFTGGIFVNGSLTLSGGKADRIYVGTGVTYASLLAEGYAYQSGGVLVKLADMNDSTAVQIVKCTHPDGLTADTACPYCDKTCGHKNINQTTGLCPECGYQMAASLTVNGTTTFFGTFPNAAAAANGKTGALLTLLKDEVVQNSISSSFGGGKITIDWNGHTLSGQPNRWNSVIALDAAELTLRDSSGTNAGGIDNRNVEAISVRGGSLTIESGTYASQVCIPSGTATVKISGGIFKNDTSSTYPSAIDAGGRYLAALMAPGHTLALDSEGRELYDVYANKATPDRTTVYVVPHAFHTFDKNGKCACGAGVPIQVDNGTDSFYFDDFESAVNQAKTLPDSTVRLLEDVTHSGDSSIYIDGGTFTIDWNGHTLSGSTGVDLLAISQSADVTLKDSSGTNAGGVRNTGLGAAVRIAVGSRGSVNIQGGTYSPNVTRWERCYGSVQISGGIFENPQDSGRSFALYDESGSPLSGMLVDGTAFAYDADGSELLNAYAVSQSDSYRTVYAVAHTHENWTDGVCDCGYTCPHAEVDEAGDCTLCGKPLYVQGTYADETTHYYGTLSDALEDPAVTQAVIIRPYVPVCESWNGGDRSVILDLNGIAVVVKSIQGGHLILRDSTGSDSNLGMAEIQKDGQVTVESGTVYPHQGETLSVSGKLTVTGGDVNSLTAMEGSTVSLSGGSFDKIVGSGVTLKELLAKDCYYAELDGETPKDYADTDTVIEQVSVALCDHTSVRENKGTYFTTYTCNCGKVTYLLTVTVGESDKKYFGDYNTGFAYAAKSDGVVRFLELNGTIEVNAQGMVTIDMENRSYSAHGRSLVIKSGSTVKLVGQGAVMSKPETGGGSGSSGTREYGEFIPVTVESGGTFVLPANNLNGEPNMAKPTQLTVQSGGTAELQGGSTQWTDVYGTLKISGGSHLYIHQYEKGQLNITGGQIQLLQIYGDLPQNALSGGSYVTISVMEFRSGETEKFRDVTFADFQKMLVSGKVFQKKQDQSYPNEVEETPNYGTFNYKKELNKVNVTAAPFTGVQAICQLGNTVHSGSVNTTYGVQEENFYLKAQLLSPAAEGQRVSYQWYQVQDGSKTEVGKDATYTLNRSMNVGVYTYQVTASCNGYELTSDPFAVTVTPRVVNITGGFTAQDRDYGPEDRSVRIIQGEVTFDKKAEGDDLGAQVHGGTVATPDAGQNRTVDYSVTLTGEDKDNYTLGSQPELTVTIRPASQTLAFAETAVTKTYGDSPFVNALVHSAGDGQITYTSSDPAVARVGIDGKVTIRGAGEARITATAAATQNYVETAASFDLTVDKATGTVRNRNYSLGYLYGDDIPTPERKYFEASSTGAFRYSWSHAAPKDAGKYQLTVTVDEDGNYTSATLVLNVLVEKDVWVRPTLVKAENETVDGKKDGKVTYTDTPALEYRIKRREWLPVAVSTGAESVTVEGLAPGTYEFRRPGDENHFASSPETITIQPGPKLTVTLPSPQTGYTLTADKVELSWHDSLKLTLTVAEGYYKTASFAVKAGDRVLTEDKGTYTLTNVEENLTITLEGVEKDEKAPSLVLRNWIFGRGAFQGWATNRDWENISTATAPYYIISTRGNYFAVVASDGETGLASASYLLSRTALTREALEQAAWEPVPEESLNLDIPDREKMIQLDLGEWYFYVKAVDKAGNVSYVGSDKLIREENAPTFGSVINGAAYYTTQKVTITDDYALSRYLAPESQNWKNISGTSYEVTLEGNREGTYTMEAEDACQNTSTLTVYMKPISSLTEDIRDLTEDNVRRSDLDKLTQAEKALKALDTTNATDEEKKTITEALDSIGTLKAVLEEVTRVEDKIAALPDSVEPYQQTVEDTQIKPARQAYSDLTDHQKTLVDSTKLDKLVRLEAQLNAWTITEGDGQTWFKGSWNPLSFTVNGQTRKFSKVLLDGKMYITATPSFLAVSGSTDEPFTLTLKPEFLQVSMEPGEHTLTVIYGENNSRTGTVTFTVEIPANYLDATNKPEFDGKTTVTVDGAEYPIEEMNGTRYVNLPETGDLLTIYSFKDGTPAGSYTNYPTGMQVFRITRQEGSAKAEEITEFANLLNYAGCSIRLTGTKGIRMITGISENARTALIGAQGLAGYTLEEYGTVVMRGVGTPTLENSNSHNFAYKKSKADPVFARAGGMIQYTNVLVGFSLEDCKDTLTLRPYIKLKDTTTGETVTLYGGCVCRSIGYIAKQNENTYKPGTAGYKYIHEILNYTQTAEQGGKTK